MSFDSVNSFSGFTPAHSLFKRCASCDSSVPTCPQCPSGQICNMVAQTCDHCATTKCIANPNAQPPSSSGSNTGAIAGGVVGGVAGLAVILFLIYWFVVRPRRAERAEQQEKNNGFAANRSRPPIAYIPGVTNRSPPETPASLVPPVPPLPGAHPDQHFFMPGDLRDSSWTTTTGGGHQSIAPSLRSSVATTIYRNDAVIAATPAQSIARARANVVSVHSGPGSGATTPTSTQAPILVTPADAPAVPAITSSQLAKAEALAPPLHPATTAPRSWHALSWPSPKKSAPSGTLSANASGTSPSNHSSQQFSHNTSTFDGSSSEDESDDEEIEAVIQQAQPTQVQSKPAPASGPLKFASPRTRTSKIVELADTSSSATLSAPSETASKRSSASGKPPMRVESPFSDANELP
ncbi:Membrane anchor Opy2 N-terminal [Penicillium chermesinum]|nr:Membrane anchor Opy2 N-terminal [Penicillium chermesinum]